MNKDNNKIIFVAGADFSGTTVLDLCISSADGGFSLGEVHAFYWKTLQRHESPNCYCKDDNCTVWAEAQQKEEHQLYATLFRNIPLVKHLVDSSKNLRWINSKRIDCKRKHIPIKIVLIWKTADAYIRSCQKRGRAKYSGFRWIAYNLACLYKFPEVYVLPFKKLVEEPEASLKELCGYLGINYDPKILVYGDKSHHTLYGNKGPRQQDRLIRETAVSSTDSSLQCSSNIVYRYAEKKLKTRSLNFFDKILGFLFYQTEVFRNYLKVKLYNATR